MRTESVGRARPKRALSLALAVMLLVALVPFQPVIALGVEEGTTWYVDDNLGNDANPGTMAEPFESVYVAIDAASDGDTIVVKPGHYYEETYIDGFTDLRIASTGGPGVTYLHNQGSVVYIIGSQDITLEGFTITDGGNEVGGGILIEASTATISNCVVTDNGAGMGGGLASFGSTVTVEGCEFSDNWAEGYGGALASEDSTLTITDCEFNNNGIDVWNDYGDIYEYYTEYGGAIELYESSTLISGTTFDGNAAESGGGVLAWGGTLDIVDSVFTDNKSDESDYYYPAGTESPRDSLYEGSARVKADRYATDVKAQQEYEPSWGAGAGLALYDGDFTVSGTEFTNNQAYNEGGAIFAGVWSTLDVADCSFDGNGGFLGGGLFFTDEGSFFRIGSIKPDSYEEVVAARTSSAALGLVEVPEAGLTVERSAFTNNESMAGSAVFAAAYAPMAIDNCVFEGNESWELGTVLMLNGFFVTSESRSAAVTALPEEVPPASTMANCTLSGNINGGAVTLGGMGPWDVRNTVMWGNIDSSGGEYGVVADAFGSEEATFTYCDFQYGYVFMESDEPTTAGEGNFTADPLFGADLALTSGSPCIDTGTDEYAPLDDITGWGRPMDGDGDGVRAWDVGAYEYFETLVRESGADRYATAVKSSQQHFDAADTVIIATGEVFADGLSSAGLAGSYEAPILLTRKNALPAVVADEIERLGATNVVVIGGANAVFPSVGGELEAAGLEVQRIGGADRYATAAMVAQELADLEGDDFSGVGFVARGDLFPDALSVSPLAYAMKSPILLVRPDSMPQATIDVIEALTFDEFMIAGGPDAVGPMAMADAAAETVQVGGIDRYDTSAKISDYAVDKGWATMSYTGIATGQNFPDALTGGAALGSENGVLLLTPYQALHSSPAFLMQKRADEVGRVEVLGGTAAISVAVWDAIDAILN